MRKEQKEGVFIVAVSILVLLVLALLTSYWQLGVSEAALYFDGFEYGVEESCSMYEEFVNACRPGGALAPGGALESSGNCQEYKNILGRCRPGRVLEFSIKFKTTLIFFLPIISYGILRAFNIIRRLSHFEEKLFCFIDENSEPDFLYRHGAL